MYRDTYTHLKKRLLMLYKIYGTMWNLIGRSTTYMMVQPNGDVTIRHVDDLILGSTIATLCRFRTRSITYCLMKLI